MEPHAIYDATLDCITVTLDANRDYEMLAGFDGPLEYLTPTTLIFNNVKSYLGPQQILTLAYLLDVFAKGVQLPNEN